MSRLRSPIVWFGGKGNMVAKILPILTAIPHTRYVEPFGGGASILMAKPPVDVETYNDLDSALYNFFTVLADPDLFPQFVRRVRFLPWSRQLYLEARATWREEPDKVKRAALWFVVARQSFSGNFGVSFSSCVTSSCNGRVSNINRWQNALKNLPRVHKRLHRVQIENQDFMTVLQRYDTPETLFYCDPPYVHATRGRGRYTNEMDIEQHNALVDALLNIKGYAVLSGYAHPVYDALSNNGWERIDWDTYCMAMARTHLVGIKGTKHAEKSKRVESVWISPRVPRQLELL